MTPRLTGWLVHFVPFTVWVQGGTSHAWARKRARTYPPIDDMHITGSTRVIDGKPGPRRPA